MNETPINDGGPAFPRSGSTPGADFHDAACEAGFASTQQPGMSLRDWFARNTPHDEVCEMTYKHLSLLAQEKLAGMKAPESARNFKGEEAANQQIAEMMFHARVNAALRYISADAMLAAAGKEDA